MNYLYLTKIRQTEKMSKILMSIRRTFRDGKKPPQSRATPLSLRFNIYELLYIPLLFSLARGPERRDFRRSQPEEKEHFFHGNSGQIRKDETINKLITLAQMPC